MTGFNLGKYRVIVVSIALFLVFDLGVLILNFYISAQISKDATAVNLAGRQRMLSQRMVKSLFDIQNKNFLQSDYNHSLNELNKTYSLFDNTIDSFRHGGEALGGDGSRVILEKIKKPEGISILEDAYKVWQPYKKILLPVLANQGLRKAQLDSAVLYARNNNIALLKLMNDLTSFLEKKATSKASFLRLIQVIGISLATLNFIVILFHFIKQLNRNDRLIEQAKGETDEILDTVNEGLFLLNRDYTVGSQYSKELENIFREKSLAGLDFKRFLAAMVKEKTLQVSVDYIDLLFGDRVNEKLVLSLNPLDRVEVLFKEGSTGFSTQYLTFKFSRVSNQNKISHLLVTVSDVTDQVRLEKELALSKEKSNEQLNLLTEVLPMDPQSLIMFLNSAQKTLDLVNDQLKKSTRNDVDYTDKVNTIFRYMHKLKGDASSLGFKYMTKVVHEFEKHLVELRETPNLSGNDFLSLAVDLESIYRLVESVRSLFDRLGSIRNALADENIADNSRGDSDSTKKLPLDNWSGLEVFAEDLACKHGKKARLDLQNFHQLPADSYRSSLRELMIQFIRNSIVHGIEEPELRLSMKKPEVGHLRANVMLNNDGSYSFIYQDDGLGFNPAKIRRAAVNKGIYTSEEAPHKSEAELIKLLFKPGFSTNASPDEDSGRGVGMDVIRTMVNEMGGKLKVASSAGKYCRFTILIPAYKQSRQVA